jgi:hypothetical protein
MSETALHKNMLRLGAGINACVEQKATLPALVLLYSAIDTSAWLGSDALYATKADFLNWTDCYLLKGRDLDCTSIDLYAARCGLLHTFSPNSRIAAYGDARLICYAWGDASQPVLQAATDKIHGSSQYTTVHFDDLYEAWRLGLDAFVNDLELDPRRKARAYAKASTFFKDMEASVVEAVAASSQST